MNLLSKASHLIASSIVLLCLSPITLASSAYTWLGLGASNDWQDTKGNWDIDNYYPGLLATDDTATFPQESQSFIVNAAGSTNVSTMTFQGNYDFTNAGRFTLSSPDINSGIIICADPINCAEASKTRINNAQSLCFDLYTSSGGATLINNANAQAINFLGHSNASDSKITNSSLVTFQGSASSMSAAITNNGQLTFSDDSNANQANISNQGTIDFNNASSAGTASINNNNNQTLNFNDSATAETASITNNGNIHFNTSANAGTAIISNNQTLDFNNTSSANQANITNLGTLYFNNASTATSAVINNSGGTIDLSAMDTATPLTITALTDNSNSHIKLGSKQLILNAPSGNSTVYGKIEDDNSGQSSFTKAGNGTLCLKGANTYSGSTNITGGTLAVDNSSALGTGPITIGNGARLNFVNSLFASAWGSPVYTNSLAGCSPTTVAQGGSLTGSGPVGSLINNGDIAPGDLSTIGTLRVNCDFTANNSSSYHVKVDNQGNSDLVSVGGHAQLGGAVYIGLLNGNYQTNTPYTILTAGTLANTFDSVRPPLTLDGELIYDYAQGTVTYQFYNLSHSLAEAVTTPNQIRVAQYLLAITVPPAVYSELTGFNTQQQLEAYLDQLSAASYADQDLSLVQLGGLFDSQMRDRIQNRQNTDPLQPWLMARKSSSKLFSQQVGGFRENPDAIAYGIEEADSQGLFGAALAYMRFHGQSVQSQEISSANGDFYQIGGYASHTLGKWLVAASASAGYLDKMNADRWIETGGGSSLSEIQARYHASLFSAQLQTSYTATTHLQPLLGLHYQNLNRSGFAEQGSTDAELTVNPAHFNSLRSHFGFAAHTTLADKLQPFVQAIWEHEFADAVSGFDASFQASGGGFHIDGVEIGREICVAKAGLEINPQANWNLSATYEARFAKNLQENSGKLQLVYKFL